MTSVANAADVSQAGSVDWDALVARYVAGEKLSVLAREHGLPWQRVWSVLFRRNVLRTGGGNQPIAGSKSSHRLRQQIRRILRKELGRGPGLRHEIQVNWPDGETTVAAGKPHPKLERILQLAVARKNVLLIGPAGCGKTFLAEQVARLLGLPFGMASVSGGISEGQLTGRLLPVGDKGRFAYVISEFVKAYETGGVFLLDEIDAADPNIMLVINAALANGKMPVANRAERPYALRHPDFICMAAANTFGTGADRQYVGRNQLDESTLDRFRIGQVEMDYDPEVEATLCPDDELLHRLQTYRQRARDARVRRVISTRFLKDAYEMKQAGWTDEMIDEALFCGWQRDEVSKVRGY